MPKVYRALITGASRGIGSAIADLFKQKNIEVIVPTRQELDLNSRESIYNFVKKLNVPIDILINNAGINKLASLEEIKDEDLDETLQVNLASHIILTKLLIPHMKNQNYGRIVNISSIWSEFSKPQRLMYSASKAGLNGFTVASAVELAPYNILVNSVAPGFVNTELTKNNNSPEELEKISAGIPLQRLAEPEEIAELVYFLSSDKNTFVTGQIIFADGGFSCV